jgi:hypothetical protein
MSLRLVRSPFAAARAKRAPALGRGHGSREDQLLWNLASLVEQSKPLKRHGVFGTIFDRIWVEAHKIRAVTPNPYTDRSQRSVRLTKPFRGFPFITLAHLSTHQHSMPHIGVNRERVLPVAPCTFKHPPALHAAHRSQPRASAASCSMLMP